jgi:hypothetical protein
MDKYINFSDLSKEGMVKRYAELSKKSLFDLSPQERDMLRRYNKMFLELNPYHRYIGR